MYRAIDVTLSTVLCAALKLVDKTHTHACMNRSHWTCPSMRTSCMERRIWIKKNEPTHKKTHTNMGAERGRNRCCGTDMHTHSHFSVLTHSLNIRFVWAKPSMAQRHPNLKTQISQSLYLHFLSFKLSNHNPQAQTAAPSSHSSLSRPLVSLFLFVLPSLLNLLGRSLSPSSPLVLPGWADD